MTRTSDKDILIRDLQKEVAALRTIISLMPGNVYWKDTSGNYLGCNENMARVYHLTSPLDVVGKNDIELMGEDLAQIATTIDDIVLKTHQQKSLEEKGFNDDGAPATYLTQKKPLYDDEGNLQGILGISFDISERKLIEEKLKIAKQRAEAASRAKSRFLAMISHELRTPLTSILGFASLLQQKSPEDSQYEYLTHIINSGSYLLSLINSLLDYNKLETNKYDLIKLPLNLKDLMRNVIDMLSGSAQLKNLPLKLEYADDVPQQLLSNSRVLRQIGINLIGNAIKFTEHGEIKVRVECIKDFKDEVKLQISVTDSGIGIPLKEQQSIFKRFYQLGNVYTRNTSLTGTGLGLAIVKKLVTLLRGKIFVKSEPGLGSTFYVTATFEKVSATDESWLSYAATVKILVVEDNPQKNIMSNLLKNTLYDTISSNEFISTLLSAQHNMEPYEIIIFNGELKSMSADILVKTIRDQDILHQPLMIALTASDESQHLYNNVLNPANLTPTVFQKELKLTWDKFHQKTTTITKFPIQKQKPYILLIEDNELIQIVHQKMLEDLGCRVDVTDSAGKTLDMLTNGYDLLFVDIGLPDIAGFELIKAIRLLHNKVAEIPIIVLTGYSEDSERQHCLRVGANEVAIKPISKAALEKILQRYLIIPTVPELA